MSARPACAAKDGPRAEAQRERILCAARQCFIDHGFHAASMADIAHTAQMSAGLMYRYFENKNAIVLAIIGRQFQEGRSQLGRLQSASELAANLVDAYSRWLARDPTQMNVALFLEINAESTRDPQIAAALREFDEMIRADLQGWMVRSHEAGGLGLPPETAGTRTFLLHCFIKGLAASAVRQPEQAPAQVKVAIEQFVERLLSP